MADDTTPPRRRGPGRPPKPGGPNPTPSFSVRVDRELRDQVDTIATQRGETRTAAVEWGLRAYVRRFGR